MRSKDEKLPKISFTTNGINQVTSITVDARNNPGFENLPSRLRTMLSGRPTDINTFVQGVTGPANEAMARSQAAMARLSYSSHLGNAVNKDTIFSHLKLLHAFQALKEEVGYSNGLWNIWDAQATQLPHADEAAKTRALSRLREKRWAVFVARAVDRYETWWRTLPSSMLQEQDMASPDSPKYMTYALHGQGMVWTAEMLPPLGK